MIDKKKLLSPELIAIATGNPAAIANRCTSADHRLACQLLGLTVGLFGLSLQVHAAGGHHAVDDAAILAPGQCQLETWFDRDSHGARSLIHIGPACRVGPVELGLNLDNTHVTDIGATTAVGPQIKWAHQLTEALSAGVVFGANWQDRSPSFVASTVVFPLTWAASETVTIHVNVGRDFRRGGEPDTDRAGAALEWAPVPAWTFVAERFRESNMDHWRAGVRYVLSQNASIDLSRAKGLHGSEPAWWTVGLSWAFAR
ncbi:hypothetical protein HZ993_12780 [Rhodoferax sp. AJA081-3]|uniref:hypothetical protein n=1 Tax=Rhodoferax sp. AJA081-3 TaxID=2752316 RepID=UPI001ADECD43|nr:hypothetical protein [Rhodoferax sp. AJA081-3]QTN26220.1 hypothetical protein HZ993_12780 [Rhodoferax sp. AJA081-3]